MQTAWTAAARAAGWARGTAVAVLALAAAGAAAAEPVATTTTLTARPTRTTLGEPVTLTATVSAAAGTPAGTVEFRDDAAVLGSAALLGSGGNAVAAGGRHSCALVARGAARCWGENRDGQLGNFSTADSAVPVAVRGLDRGVVKIVTGEHHSCALTGAGAVLCWGFNIGGQIGDGTTTTRYAPTPVAGLDSGVIDIAAGYTHSCAVTAAGGVLCWGANLNGQLGDGTLTRRLVPTPVTGLAAGVAAIRAGWQFTCALTDEGRAQCWGANQNGQIGDGSLTDRLVPTPVQGLGAGLSALATGAAHACAVTAAGGLRCWGDNSGGQLGDGTTTDRPLPVAVRRLARGVVDVAAGGLHSCALTDAGGLKCWGSNRFGQLGDGGTAVRLQPGNVRRLTEGVAAVAAGDWHACALLGSGGYRCWGENYSGQIGNGTTGVDALVPMAVRGREFGPVPGTAVASLVTTALTVGRHRLAAAYGGSDLHAGSQSPPVGHRVLP